PGRGPLVVHPHPKFAHHHPNGHQILTPPSPESLRPLQRRLGQQQGGGIPWGRPSKRSRNPNLLWPSGFRNPAADRDAGRPTSPPKRSAPTKPTQNQNQARQKPSATTRPSAATKPSAALKRSAPSYPKYPSARHPPDLPPLFSSNLKFSTRIPFAIALAMS
ncbi:MAG: hypothetical protein ACI9D0_001731, partial [Bacteroidia bacterium]